MTSVVCIIGFLSLFICISSAADTCNCPDGWVVYKNSCYTFINKWNSYVDAKALCKTLNANLVDINDADEDQFLSTFLITFSNKFVAWFGATDADTEGTWMWEQTGQSLTYTHWGPGQPGSDRGDEDCVILQNFGQGYMWDDARCTDFAYVICEKPRTSGALIG